MNDKKMLLLLQYLVCFCSGPNDKFSLNGSPEVVNYLKLNSRNATYTTIHCVLKHCALQVASGFKSFMKINVKTLSPSHKHSPSFALVLTRWLKESWADIRVMKERANTTVGNLMDRLFVNELSPFFNQLKGTFVAEKLSQTELDILLLQIKRKTQNREEIHLRLSITSKTRKMQFPMALDRYMHLQWAAHLSSNSHLSQQQYLVSLRGQYQSVTVQKVGSHPKSADHLDNKVHLFWLSANYGKYKSCVFSRKQLLPHKVIKTDRGSEIFFDSDNFTFGNKNYCILRQTFVPSNDVLKQSDRIVYEDTVVEQSKAKMSWLQASKFCRSVKGILPVITSKEALFDILALIKWTQLSQVLHGVYFGLVTRSEQVGNYLSSSWPLYNKLGGVKYRFVK